MKKMKAFIMKRLIVFLSLICSSHLLLAGKVDTLAVYSASMNRNIKTVIITPQHYQAATAAGKKFPVLYLLHGYSGNHGTWVHSAPYLMQKADELEMIIVCPNGENSWYLDAPQNKASRFETFVAKELVQYVDDHYKTLADRTHRAITGLSMGGHGALYLAMRHQNTFGAAGSMAGGVDFRPFPENWELPLLLGDIKKHPENWNAHTVIQQTSLLKPGALQIIFDCGTDDFFFDVNRQLHAKLLEMKIPHDYTERPGEHNGAYWTNALRYQLVFFSDYFNKQLPINTK